MTISAQTSNSFRRYCIFFAITLVNVSACTAIAEEKMSMSKHPQQELDNVSEQQTSSSNEQLRNIKEIIEQIDNTSKKSPMQGNNLTANSGIQGTKDLNDTLPLQPENNTDSEVEPIKGKMKRKMKEKMSSNGQTSEGMGMGMGMKKMKGQISPDTQGLEETTDMTTMKMNKSMMGQRPSIQTISIQASNNLPGYPQARHLYHLGEVEFYLDHSQHLSFTNQQKEALMTINNKWKAYRKDISVQISNLEQSLWQATAQGQPDIVDIRKKVSDIEALNVQLRLAFIDRVGKAVTVLTAEQVGLLTSGGSQP